MYAHIFTLILLVSEMIAFLREHSRTVSPTGQTQPASSTHSSSVPQSTDQSDNTVPKPEIPPSLPALSKDDYEDVKFWRIGDWNQFQADGKKNGREVSRLGFLTDEDGDELSSSRRKEIYEWFSVLASSLFRAREDPKTWKKKTKFAIEFISNSLREKFLEFRLCEGDWKVEKYGSIKYSDWDKGHRTGGQLKRMSQLLYIILQYFRFYLGDRLSMNVNAASHKRKHEEDEQPLTKSKKTKRPQSETVFCVDSEDEEMQETSDSVTGQLVPVCIFILFLIYLLLHPSDCCCPSRWRQDCKQGD